MVFCAVIGCSNNSQKTRGVSYYRFPSLRNRGTIYGQPECAKRLAMWIKALRRADLTMNKITHERVCSKHFITGAPASFNDVTNPDWVPSLNLGYTKVNGKFKRTSPDKEDVYDDEDVEEEEEEEEIDYPVYGKGNVTFGTTCIICKNNLLNTRKKDLNISYYRFPVDDDLLLKWKDRCNLQDSSVLKSARICSEHFNEDDFHSSSFQGKRQLKPEAIPSVNLDYKAVKVEPRRQKIKGNSSNSEEEVSGGSDYEDTFKVRIAPMNESSSDEERPKRKKRKLSTGSDIKALNCDYSSDESGIDGKWGESTWTPPNRPKAKSKKKSTGRRRKVYDDRADDDFDPLGEELDKQDESPSIAMPPSLGSMLKEGKVVPDDRETIIKMLEERILEHSRIIEDNNVTPFSKSKKKGYNSSKPTNSVPSEQPAEKNVELDSTSVPASEQVQIEEKNETPIKVNEKIKLHPNFDFESIPDDYDALKKKYKVLLKVKHQLQKENIDLKDKLKVSGEELVNHIEQIKVANQARVNITAKLTKIEKCLSTMLTPNQIKLLLHDVKKVSWTPQEMLSAFTIRYLSKRCYYYLRQKLNYPLPGISSVQRWAAVMTKQHGGNLKEVENAVYQISGDFNEQENEEEDEEVMFFPNATDDIVIEGSNEPETIVENNTEMEMQEELPVDFQNENRPEMKYIAKQENWEQLVTEGEIEEYSVMQEQNYEDESEKQTQGPMLKALLEGEHENGEQSEVVHIVQEDGTVTQADHFPHKVIYVEAVEGADPSAIEWQMEETEEGHYYVTEEEGLVRLENNEAVQIVNEEESTVHKKPEPKNKGDNDQILHYLYGINEVSPLNVNNSADHSYAIATIDKYIRTKERHKNRKPPRKS